MTIQWFPGHMNSARRKAAETMARIDVVIEVVDARIPEASCNPMLHELRKARQRGCVKLLNKADLADPSVTKQWLAQYRSMPDVAVAAISCKTPTDIAKVLGLARKVAPHRNDATKPLRLMIMGIPNVGKSTLMNALLKRRVAKVGDEPAVTKSQQTLDIDLNTTVTDTPGMLWPRIDFPSDGLMLAASHAVGRNAMIDEEVADFLGGILLARYPDRLKARYSLEPSGMDAPDLIEAIAARRGYRISGGGLDLGKSALTLLQDYRTGALGRVSLETPESRREMVLQNEEQANPGSGE